MRNYRYTIGTKDAMKKEPTKLVNNESNPTYARRQNIIEQIKNFYKGDTNNEWQ